MRLLQLTIITILLCTLPLMGTIISATPKINNLKVYQTPFLNSNIIYIKSDKNKFDLKYCNKYKWCKLKNEKGFVKQDHILLSSTTNSSKVFIKKRVKKKIPNIPQKNEIKKSHAYKEALISFKKKDFKKSFLLFSKLLSKYPSNEHINFYYGRSAYELKNYEYAFTAYDNILINTPDNTRVRAEFARTLMMMKAYKEAKKEFTKILLSPIPITVRKNIEKLMSIIDKKEKNYILNKVAIFGFGWDDNIDNNTHLNTTAYGSIDLNNDTKQKHDTHMNLILVGNLIIPTKNSKTAWESTLVSFVQEQSRYKDNNLLLLSLSSGVSYTNKSYKNLTSLTYDHIWIGGNKTLYLYGITNSVKYKLNKKEMIKLDIKLKKKKFVEEDNYDKSSQIEELTLGYDKILSNNKDKISLSTSYIEERKRQGTRTDVDKNTNKYQISYLKNILSYDATVNYQKELNKYKEITTNLPKRDDDKQTVSVKLAKKISKTKTISLEYKNIKNNSNINTYTYKKQSVNLNYTFVF